MDHNDFLRTIPGPLVGVEVGVFEGDNALRMCTHLELAQLYLVDPYFNYPPEVFISGGIYEQEKWDAIESRMLVKLGIGPTGEGLCCGRPVKHLKFPSVEASRLFADEFFDFIYIDANHAYEYVKADLESWYPKIKSGGWVMGHDWPWPTVQRAVNEFVAERGLALHPNSSDFHITKQGQHDWWLRKP